MKNRLQKRKCADSKSSDSGSRVCKVMNCPWGKSFAPFKYDKIQSNAICVNIDEFVSIDDVAYDRATGFNNSYKPR